MIYTVEEVLPFLEDNVRILSAGLAERIGIRRFHGRGDGTLPTVDELNPGLAVDAAGDAMPALSIANIAQAKGAHIVSTRVG